MLLMNIFTDISTPWYVTRSAGIVAYMLMFFVIVLGEGMATGFAYRFITPVKAWTTHKYLGIALGVTILVHMTSLLFDNFTHFSISDILIPFSASYSPLYLTLGIIGFHLLLIVIVSSLLVRVKFPTFWRKLHYLVYPMFVVGFFHGVLLGTDTKTLPMQALYALTGTIFVVLLVHRWRFHLSRA